MDMIYDALVLALILGPAEPANVPDVPRVHPLYQSLIRQNIALDVWDSHDGYGQFHNEIAYTRNQYRAMVDYPPSSDRFRWLGFRPCEEVAFYAACLDRAYALDNMRAVAEVGGQLETWRTLWRVVEPGSTPCRRRALYELREAIGPDAYYSGRMP